MVCIVNSEYCWEPELLLATQRLFLYIISFRKKKLNAFNLDKYSKFRDWLFLSIALTSLHCFDYV